MDDEPRFREGRDREDPRQWRIDSLPQTQGGMRTRWSLHRIVIAGLVAWALWFAAGYLFGFWGAGLILGPIGLFLIAWGLIQEVLAIVSMETFRDDRHSKKK